MPVTQGDTAPVAQRSLPSSIDDLKRAVAALETTIYGLQSQLHLVLDSPTCISGEQCDGKASLDTPKYATQISSVVSRIRELTSLGNDLMTRLHV